jgi:hypothetical protein
MRPCGLVESHPVIKKRGQIMVSANLSDLRDMDEAQREQQLSALVSASQQQSDATGAAVLQARIDKYERRYEMSSEEMLDQVAKDELKETAEISKWLFLLSARDHVAG